LFLSPVLLAQNLTFFFKGTVDNSDLGKNEAGVTVSIVQNGSSIVSATTASNGKYSLRGNVNYTKPFSVVFTKSGMVSKKVDFNLTLMNEEDIPAGSEYQPVTDLSVSLFAERPEADFSFLKTEPVAKFEWDQNKAVASADMIAAQKMKEKIEKLLAASESNAAENDAKYQAAVAAADGLYTQKKYVDARAKYEEANQLKPKEPHPIQRINELDALIQAQKEAELADQQANAEYYNLIKSADALRDSKKYDEAIAKYNEALDKRPDETYPKDQIEAVGKLKKEAENQAKYQEAVTQADAFYNQKSYKAAKEKYTLANKLKPSEQHPINRLKEIEKKLLDESAATEKKQKYDDAIAAADILFNEQKWEEAKVKYIEALTYESSSTYATGKIKECEAKLLELAKEKEKLDKINKLLSEGEVLFNGKRWTDAKTKYTEVISLDNQNETAKTKLDEIAKKIAEESDLAAQEAKFNKLVSEGDLATKGLKYEDAKTKYEAALLIKEDAPTSAKLEDVKKKIQELKDKEDAEAKFLALKAEGMKLATEQKWLDAKTKLTEALGIHADAAITAKLKEIEAKIQADQALVQLEEDYNKLIAEAQVKEAAKDYDGAIAKYKEATVKKSNEQMPKDKVKELEALKLGDAKQREIDEKYAAFMKKGKDLMANKNYLDAIKEFNLALEQKPTEKEPSDLAAEAERLEKEKKNEGDVLFEKILTAAQNKIDEKDYVNARKYANQAAYNRNDDQRPKDLLKKIDELEKQQNDYTAKMMEAETFASAKEYTKAIGFFEQAKTIKPDETKPQERIDELNKLIADQSSEKEKEQLYKDYMTKGSLSQTSKQYEQALSHYQNALEVKKNDQIAEDKIKEVQQILDDIANAAKNETDRKNQFDAFILAGDNAFGSENYIDAKANYTKALGLDEASMYAKKQIEECDKRQLLKDQSLADAEYTKLIQEADDFFGIKSYDKAKEAYNRAVSIRSADQYPKDKLIEIDAILNPVVVKSGSLEPLGEPYEENSIMDGYAALVKADIERKNLKDEKLQNRVEGIQEAESDMTTQKTVEQQVTTLQINAIVNKISVANDDADLNRQALVDALKRAETELAEAESENESYKHAENIRNQESLNVIVANSATDNSIRSGEQEKNVAILSNYQAEYGEELRLQNEREEDMSVQADQKLIGVHKYLQAEGEDDYDERKVTEQAVEQIVQKAEKVENELSYAKQDELVNNKEAIEAVDIAVSEKAQVDSKNAAANNETIKSIEKVVSDTETVKSEEQMIHASEINLKVDEINTSIAENDIVRDLNRQATVDILSDGNNSIEQAAFEAYNKESEKYLKNEIIINNEVIKNNGISEKADENHAMNVNSIDLLDKKATIVNEEIALSDDEERLRARANVEMYMTNAEERTVISTEKQENNAYRLDDVNKTIEAGQTNMEAVQQDKHYDAQAKLNSVENKQPEKVKLANTLGQEYPEGVSQESFTQTDEDGLMTAIITRRIVVINGTGNVYVRTQTLQATTYTKNGTPTTEYLWQKETTGPSLEKHY